MTIAGTTNVHPVGWRGSDDPASPEGVWYSSGTVVGDASGGLVLLRTNFKEEGELLSGDIWNIEQLDVFIGDETLTAAFWRIVGMAPVTGSSHVDRIGGIALTAAGSALGQAAAAGGRGGFGQLKLPMMLGTVRGTQEDVACFDIGRNNIGVGAALSVTMMGYRWGPRSILAPGGPQRPVNSVFGG